MDLNIEFQSTHSRRVRPSIVILDEAVRLVSIHALTKSATLLLIYALIMLFVSIHALTKSATICFVLDCPVYRVSIHALTKSAT